MYGKVNNRARGHKHNTSLYPIRVCVVPLEEAFLLSVYMLTPCIQKKNFAEIL